MNHTTPHHTTLPRAVPSARPLRHPRTTLPRNSATTTHTCAMCEGWRRGHAAIGFISWIVSCIRNTQGALSILPSCARQRAWFDVARFALADAVDCGLHVTYRHAAINRFTTKFRCVSKMFGAGTQHEQPDVSVSTQVPCLQGVTSMKPDVCILICHQFRGFCDTFCF